MIASYYTKCVIFVLNNQQNTKHCAALLKRPFSNIKRAAQMNLKKYYHLIFP